jgi:hypothetical protein
MTTSRCCFGRRSSRDLAAEFEHRSTERAADAQTAAQRGFEEAPGDPTSLTQGTSCSSAPPTSTDCSIRDGPVVSPAAATLLLQASSSIATHGDPTLHSPAAVVRADDRFHLAPRPPPCYRFGDSALVRLRGHRRLGGLVLCQVDRIHPDAPDQRMGGVRWRRRGLLPPPRTSSRLDDGGARLLLERSSHHVVRPRHGGRQLVPDNLGHARVTRRRDCSLLEAVSTAPRRLEACGVPSHSCRRKLAPPSSPGWGRPPIDESRRCRGSV